MTHEIVGQSRIGIELGIEYTVTVTRWGLSKLSP